MDKAELEFEWQLNSPEAKAEANTIEQALNEVGDAGENAEKRVQAAVQKTTAAQREQIGIIERLKQKIAEFKEAREKAMSTTSIEKYNIKIQEFQKEIDRLNKNGKQGFDDMGNAIPDFSRPTGMINRLTEAAKLYAKAAKEATNPELIAKYNRKLQETEAHLKRLNNVGKQGFDELGNKVEQAKNKTGGLMSSIKGLAGAIGLTFALSTIIEWGKELFKIANTASGIERAFSAIGGSDALQKLRTETKGFVTDLELEKLTVQAKNLNVPIDNLGTYLAFAAQRAKDTGADVQQLTNDIINGLGRESPRVIDNLGISQKELNKEIAKTGDFAKAVANIMKRSMNEAGVAVDTLADKTNRLSTWWDNLKTKTANFFSRTFNPDLADNKVIGDLTQSSLKQIGDFSKVSAKERDEYIKYHIGHIKKLSDEYVKITKKYEKAVPDSMQKIALAAKKKEWGEALAASQNVLKAIKDVDRAQSVKERQGKGIFNINELDEKIDNLTLKFKDTLDPKERAKLKKQIDEATKLRDEMEGKEKKVKGAKSDDTQLREQRALQQKITDIQNEYARKSKTNDEAEIKAVRDKFAKLSKEVEIFNKNPKNKLKVDGSQLTVMRDNAIADLVYKQDTAKQQIEFEKQKKLFEDYEKYKTTYGEKAANERFKDVKTNSERLLSLQQSYAALALKATLGGGLTGGEDERMKQQEVQVKALSEIQEKEYQEAFQAALTHEQQILLIKEKYAAFAAALGANITEAQKAELKRRLDDEINAANQTAYQKSGIYRRLSQQLITYTREQLVAEIQAAERILKDANLDPYTRSKVQKQLGGLKTNLSIGVNQTNVNALNSRKADLVEALKLPKSVEEAEKLNRELIEVQRNIDAIDQNGDGIANWADKVASSFSYLKGSTEEAFAGLSNDFSRVGGAFGQLSSSLQDTNADLAYTIGNIGELMNVASDAAGAAASFASGDIIGGVTKTISAVAGIFSIGSKVKKMNAEARAEQAKFYQDALNGERAYQALLRKRELDDVKRNKNSYKAIIAQLDLLKKQSPEIEAAYDRIFSSLQGQQFVDGVGYKHGTWFRKAKTWDIMASLAGADYERLEQLYTQGKLKDQAKADFESLKALREELQAAGVEVEELEQQLRELLTGTTVSGLADGLTELFQNGKKSAADFGQSFEDILRNAVVSSFKAKYLQDAMQPFYEELANMMKGSSPTAEQIAALKAQYQQLGKEGADQFAKLSEIFGIDLETGDKNSNQNTIKGNVANITAQQADVLSGNIGGMRMALIDFIQRFEVSSSSQMADLKSQLLYIQQIAANTLRTADNTDRLGNIELYLKSMDNKLTNNNNAIRAAGG